MAEYLRLDVFTAISRTLSDGMPGWHIYLEEQETLSTPSIMVRLATLAERKALGTRRYDDYTIQLVAIVDGHRNKDYYGVAQQVQYLLEQPTADGAYALHDFTSEVQDRSLYMLARVSVPYRRVAPDVPVMETITADIRDITQQQPKEE